MNNVNCYFCSTKNLSIHNGYYCEFCANEYYLDFVYTIVFAPNNIHTKIIFNIDNTNYEVFLFINDLDFKTEVFKKSERFPILDIHANLFNPSNIREKLTSYLLFI